MKNRKNNKGFSLVELIVVVAIMAVLVGVLAPAYLRYVEKSRIQKDESAVAEVVQAVKVACSEETAVEDITATTTITVTNGAIAGADTTTDDLLDEVATTISAPTFTSKKHQKADADTYTITLTVDANGVSVNEYAADNWS